MSQPKKKIIIKRIKPKQTLELTSKSSTTSISNEIDLFEKNTQFDIDNSNQQLIDLFEQLVTQIEYQILAADNANERKKHGFRLRMIKGAIDIFENYPGKITSGVAAKKIKGIGSGISKRIDEIIQTGTLGEIKDKQYVTTFTETIKDLLTVTGIGKDRARKLIVNYGVTGVNDLMQKFADGQIKVGKNQLTHHIVIGLKYYEDFLKRIPRAEISEMEQLLLSSKNQLDPELILQICGSYRRNKQTSGDIDVLITHPKLITKDQVITGRPYLIELLDLLTEVGFIIDSLTDRGKTKYMGVCKLGSNNIPRRIDIRFVPYDSYAPGLMYFTGSMQFNKISRGIANQKGYTLNEYGIYYFKDRKKGDKIPVFSEQDIFKLIGIKYLEPWERDL